MFSEKDHKNVKIIDFGYSTIRKRLQWVQRVGGTARYCGPECIHNGITEASDMFSLGIIVYELFFGRSPFDPPGRTRMETLLNARNGLINKIKSGNGNWFPSEKPISEEARSFIAGLIQVKPGKRMTASEAIHHAFIRNQGSNGSANSEESLEFVLENVMHRQSVTKVEKFLRQVIIQKSEKPRHLVNHLTKLFKKYDTDQDGMLDWEEFHKAMLESTKKLHISELKIKSLFAAIDIKRKGKIAYRDLLSWVVFERLSSQDDRIYDAVVTLDVNENGEIDPEDVESLLQNPDIKEQLSQETIEVVRDMMGDGPMQYLEVIDYISSQTPDSHDQNYLSGI